ncbi:MAG: phosphatase PAP2 family protein [Elusimicrobia bacterium]|nr:phosphatase PAP2 family protein [Elusimicrobiota bacterium]
MASLGAFLAGMDQALFEKINLSWTHPWLDAFFPWLTDLDRSRVFVFGALPVILAWWIYKHRGRAVKILLAMVLAVGVCDAVAYRFIKPLVGRSRPSGISVALRTRHHGGLGFPSNHAANTFAGAAVLGMAVPHARWPAMAMAGLVAYSRVYVGVHYPFDVLVGAMLGLLGGGLTGSGLLRYGRLGAGPSQNRTRQRS